MDATDGKENVKDCMKQKKFNIYADFKAVKEEDGFVCVEGYASTFSEDLDGETVAPGAFNETLSEYKMNPVVLADHTNAVQNVVGKVIDAKVDQAGLWVKVQLSNSKDPYTTMVREKVQEGLLRAFSIGGLFEYDYPTIKRVKLLEISIVGIPANPTALFSLSKAWAGLDIEERHMEPEPGAPEPMKPDPRQLFIKKFIELKTKEDLIHG